MHYKILYVVQNLFRSTTRSYVFKRKCDGKMTLWVSNNISSPI